MGLQMGEALAAARLFGAADELLTVELLAELEIGVLSGIAKRAAVKEE